MKKVFRQLFVALCLMVAPTTMSAQSLVFHLPDGGLSTVTLPVTFTFSASGDKLIIENSTTRVELDKNRILAMIYRPKKGDVNEDMQVDVADIATVIDIMAGKGDDTQTEEKAYTTCPNENHPHWIDLGIGTQWRCCNAGASSPEEYGGYYTFDEAQAYNPPTRDQIDALLNNCSYTWTTQNGVRGGKFTGPNGGTIFLPAAGYVWDGELYDVGSFGDYWSSTPNDEIDAYYLNFHSSNAGWGYDDRGGGVSVRPVR